MKDHNTQFMRLEDPIADLTRMASVACSISEKFSQEVDSSRDFTGIDPNSVVHTIEQQFEDLSFCVYQLLVRSRELNELYHAEPAVPA